MLKSIFKTRSRLTLHSSLPLELLMARLKNEFEHWINRSNYEFEIAGNTITIKNRHASNRLGTPLTTVGTGEGHPAGSRMHFLLELKLTAFHFAFIAIWYLFMLIMLAGGMVHMMARDLFRGNVFLGVLGATLFLLMPYFMTCGYVHYMEMKLKTILKRINRGNRR